VESHMSLKEFRADLHIHTSLSPCADLTMVPSALITQAEEMKLNGIGICDHNSAENVIAVKKAGEKKGMPVLGGIEIASREEVHMLAYFDENEALLEMQDKIYKNLSGENDAAYFGEQLVADENDNFIESNDKLLISATDLSINEIVSLIHRLGGIAVASHIDRETFSIIGQLGFIPEDISLDGLEVSSHYKPEQLEDYKKYRLPLITSSDAHFLYDIGKCYTTFFLEAFTVAEVSLAFESVKGRKVVI